MFSTKEKQEISDKIQKILRDTNHVELPEHEISFNIHIDGAKSWYYADIHNNASYLIVPNKNPWNEINHGSKTKDPSKEES